MDIEKQHRLVQKFQAALQDGDADSVLDLAGSLLCLGEDRQCLLCGDLVEKQDEEKCVAYPACTFSRPEPFLLGAFRTLLGHMCLGGFEDLALERHDFKRCKVCGHILHALSEEKAHTVPSKLTQYQALRIANLLDNLKGPHPTIKALWCERHQHMSPFCHFSLEEEFAAPRHPLKLYVDAMEVAWGTLWFEKLGDAVQSSPSVKWSNLRESCLSWRGRGAQATVYKSGVVKCASEYPPLPMTRFPLES